MVVSQLRGPVTKLMEPLYHLLNKIGFHPNMITVLGLGTSLVAGWAFASGEYIIASIMIMASGIFDVLDGGVARVGGFASNEGAFIDSFADRLGESAIYIGLVLGFDNILEQLLALSILVLSYSISYLRARGEGLGVSLDGIGVMERAERLGTLFTAGILAAIWGKAVFIISLSIILALILITVVHRFIKVYIGLKKVEPSFY